MNEIGITERGDAALEFSWLPWVRDGNPAILITKDPARLFRELLVRKEESAKFNVIIHATITGLGGSIFEPKVPDKATSLKGYKDLIQFYSADRVVLRIDPIIPNDSGIRIAKKVLAEKQGRVRISFIDQYPHTKARFKEAGIILPWGTFHAPIELRKKAYEKLGQPDICGEPDFECTGCISEKDCVILGVAPKEISGAQRKFCACLANKKELLKDKDQCPHACLYCYWGKP